MYDDAGLYQRNTESEPEKIKKIQFAHQDLIEGGHSCSIKGAILFCHHIDKGLPLIHGGPGCSIQPYWGSMVGKGEIIPTANSGVCSNEIIYGGEKKLKNAISASLRIYSPELMVVASGCQTATVGDNVDAVIDEVVNEENVDIPIINAQTSGYDGNIIDGYIKTGIRLLSQLCKPQDVEQNTINLLGFPAGFNVYWKGDMVEVRNLIKMLGIKIHCIFPGDCSVEKIVQIPKACLNVVIDEQFGLEQAIYLNERFGTPYILPKYGTIIGADNTTELLLEIVEKLQLDYQKKNHIIEETKRRGLAMACQGHFLWYESIMSGLNTFGLTLPGGLALGITRLFMGELGIEPKYINLYPSYPGAMDKICELLEADGRDFKPILMENADDKELLNAVGEKFPKIVIGRGATNKSEFLLNGTLVYMQCTYPTMAKVVIYNRPLMGYNGIAMILQEVIDKATYFF